MEIPQQKSVALTDTEITIVEQLNVKWGLNNFSAALRMIVREWQSLQVISDAEHVKLTPASAEALKKLSSDEQG